MKGDFTRFTHDPRKHYTRVLRQQGRLDLDADWTEAEEIRTRLHRIQAHDLLGDTGAPHNQAGFQIDPTPDGQDLQIGAGRLYVDGILCELEEATTYHTQPDYPNAPALPLHRPRTDLIYLEVWDRHVTALEDPTLREVALGGPDTTTRVQTIAQVKALDLPAQATPQDIEQAWTAKTAPTTARLTTRLHPDRSPHAALGNHLYRIEIHHAGEPLAWPRPTDASSLPLTPDDDLEDHQIRLTSTPTWTPGQWIELHNTRTDAAQRPGPTARILAIDGPVLTLDRPVHQHRDDEAHARPVATYKWSRDNGAVAHAIESFSPGQGDELVLAPGPIPLDPGDLVEVLGDTTELHHAPGTLAHVETVDEARRRIRLTTGTGRHAHETHPKIRRWDGTHCRPVRTDEDDEIEDGILVRFQGTRLQSGDHWTFTTRTASHAIETLDAAPPRGIPRHHCRLATIQWDQERSTVTDVRRLFSSLADVREPGVILVGDGVISHGHTNDLGHAVRTARPGSHIRALLGDHILLEPLEVLVDGLRIEGTSDGVVIHAPHAQPALTDCGHHNLTLHNLDIRGDGATGLVRLHKTHHARIEQCRIGTTDDHELRPDPTRTPAFTIWTDGIERLRLVQNTLHGGLTALHGTHIEARDNDQTGAGLWLLDGTTHAHLQNNTIHHGTGPGIALGGLHPDRAPGPTPLRNIRLTDNHIHAMTGSGIQSGPSPHGTTGLGIVERLHATHNHIHDCAQRSPDDADDEHAGILLRNAVHAHLANNEIRDNGTRHHDHPTHGLAILGCIGLDIHENTIRDNGTTTPTWTPPRLQAGALLQGIVTDPPQNAHIPHPAPTPASASAALRFLRNEIIQPLGPALAAHGAGPMTLHGNRFSSHGVASGAPWTHLGHCVTICNLGQDLVRTRALLDPHNPKGLHLESRHRIPWTDLPPGDPLPDGHIQFLANQVHLHAEHAPDDGATLALLSHQDLALQDNQITAHCNKGHSPGTVLAWAPAVRATGNLVTSTAPTHASLQVVAQWDLLANNQTSHGIHTTTRTHPDSTNHLLCRPRDRPRPRTAPDLLDAADEATPDLLDTILTDLAANLTKTPWPDDPLNPRFQRIHNALQTVQTTLQAHPTTDKEWIVTGRVFDPDGSPATGLTVHAEPRGYPLFWWPRTQKTKTDTGGTFAFTIRRRDVTTLWPRLRITVHDGDDRILRGRHKPKFRRGKEDHFEIILDAGRH